MDPLEQIFINYAGKTIEMDFADPNSDWSQFIGDLSDYFGEDELENIMSKGELDSYLDDYNITLMEPVSDPMVDPEVLKKGNARIEIDKMRRIAGLPPLDDPISMNEEEEKEEIEEEEMETKEIIVNDPVLTFNSEEDRDRAIMYYKDPNNHPKEVLKHTRGKLQMQPEDAVSIIFPSQANQQACGLDERKLKGIVEIMHRHINKKYPNSKTAKIESK